MRCDNNLHHPVLTLRLSHANFLDAVLTSDGQPVYSLETVANQTTMLRCNTFTDGLENVASIVWPEYESRRKSPKDSGVCIRIHDSPLQAENDFLKLHTGVISASRKFHLPGQERALKWRRNGAIFECTTPTSTMPIAHFEPAHAGSPGKLKVFVHDLHFQHNFRDTQTCGVNTTLLEYLILTSILLVTHKDDWRSLPSAHTAPGSSSSSSPVSPTSPVTPYSYSSPPSPISPPTSESWYRSPDSSTQTYPGSYTHQHTHSHSSSSSSSSSAATTTQVVRVRAPTQRPRTSPSTSVANTSPSTSVRRTISQFSRSQAQTTQSTPVDMETSPVLDIRPTLPAVQTRRTRTRSTVTTSTAPLRLHVPTSPLPSTPHFGGRRSPIEVDPTLAQQQEPVFLKNDPADLPPPYEEIEWTVRLRAPRRIRSSIGQ